MSTTKKYILYKKSLDHTIYGSLPVVLQFLIVKPPAFVIFYTNSGEPAYTP
jgi:hypothetical protein